MCLIYIIHEKHKYIYHIKFQDITDLILCASKNKVLGLKKKADKSLRNKEAITLTSVVTVIYWNQRLRIFVGTKGIEDIMFCSTFLLE